MLTVDRDISGARGAVTRENRIQEVESPSLVEMSFADNAAYPQNIPGNL